MNKSILSLTLSEIISLKPFYKLQPFNFINNPLLFFGLILWVCMETTMKPFYKLQPFNFINNPLLFFGLILWVCMVALTKFSFATR